MNWIRNASLLRKLLLATNVIGTVLLGSLGTLTIIDSKMQAEKALAMKMAVLIHSLNVSSRTAIWNMDVAELTDLVTNTVKDPDINSVVFRDKDGKPYTEVAGKKTDQPEGMVKEEILDKTGGKLGWVEMTYNFKSVNEVVAANTRMNLIAIFAILTMFSVLMYLILRRITNGFTSVVDALRGTVSSTTTSSVDVNSASQKLSSAAAEQASSIQEAVATLNQISAMVSKSVESARLSSTRAESSHQVAEEGKVAIQDMMGAMDEINKSNQNVIDTIKRSNDKIQGIVAVITEISNKTNVINDIVFQTKLLSFNASVEAARAGEHGKGFAVVAEEVGSLAAMSGNAAREIGTMLKDSIEKVQNIVTETRQGVDVLIESGQGKIEAGVSIARRCGEVFEEVLVNVAEVKSMMNEIASASEEQATGVNNVSAAMHELDQATQSNSNTAHETATYSATLAAQAQQLESVVHQLETRVFGSRVLQPTLKTRASKSAGKKNSNVVPLGKQVSKRTKSEKSNSNELSKEGKSAESAKLPSTIEVSTPEKKAVGMSEIPDGKDSRFEDL